MCAYCGVPPSDIEAPRVGAARLATGSADRCTDAEAVEVLVPFDAEPELPDADEVPDAEGRCALPFPLSSATAVPPPASTSRKAARTSRPTRRLRRRRCRPCSISIAVPQSPGRPPGRCGCPGGGSIVRLEPEPGRSKQLFGRVGRLRRRGSRLPARTAARRLVGVADDVPRLPPTEDAVHPAVVVRRRGCARFLHRGDLLRMGMRSRHRAAAPTAAGGPTG